MGLQSFAQCKFANTSLPNAPNASSTNRVWLHWKYDLFGKWVKLELGELVLANLHWAKDQSIKKYRST